MADTKKFDLDAIERNWIRKALQTQVATVSRSRAKEDVGSEVYNIRTREMTQLAALASKFD